MTRSQILKCVAALILTVCVDQCTKASANNLVLNTGISFGLFPSAFLTIGVIIILIAILQQFGNQFFQASPLATGVFIGGSLSNILDRIHYGGVRDFLPVPFLSIQNNLADWAIALSLIWLLFRLQRVLLRKEV